MHNVSLHNINCNCLADWWWWKLNELFTVTAVVCSTSLLCSLVATFITDGNTKKIINLVLGAFIICCMIIPIKNAVGAFNINLSEQKSSQEITATDDEAYSKAVINLTKSNLEQTLSDLLMQNNVEIDSCEIILSQTDNNSIIISSVSIYISNEYLAYADEIIDITYNNFGVKPSILTE